MFIYSAGTYWSSVHYVGQTPFYIKQAIYFIIALVGCVILMNAKLLQLERTWTFLYVLSLLLLVAVLIPGVGIVRNGSQSWIGLGPLTLQPAELVKITTLVYLSFVLAKGKMGKVLFD